MSNQLNQISLQDALAVNTEGLYSEYYRGGWDALDLSVGKALLQSLQETCETNGIEASAHLYGDSSLGLEVGGKTWRVEDPHPMRDSSKTLPKVVWVYLRTAMEEAYRLKYFGAVDTLVEGWEA